MSEQARKEAEREGGISSPFIKRPVATSLLAAAVLLAGGAAYFNLPVAPLPDIDFPTVSVSAALLGGLPLALGRGIGSELRRPLGITIVGGLLLSQVLTLYTTPVIYLYMERAAAWVRRKRGVPERAAAPVAPESGL